jgi:ABC-2 type transport system ATP-binding protein
VKRFGNFTAVDRLDLKVKEGELYGLLGPNGAGKTTAVKVLCGLLKQSAGTVRVLGRIMPGRSILPQMGYMPQNLALYETLTIAENMALFGSIYGLSSGEIDHRTDELLRVVGLPDWKDAVVNTLSGGMKHRASLACTLIHRPKLLFLDEPTVGVDPELRATFWEYFGGLVREGVTVVLTTHYMDEASRCGRVGLMRKGKMVAEGTPRQIMSSSGTTSLEDAFLTIVSKGVRGRAVGRGEKGRGKGKGARHGKRHGRGGPGDEGEHGVKGVEA